jgi:hypothetical protein
MSSAQSTMPWWRDRAEDRSRAAVHSASEDWAPRVVAAVVRTIHVFNPAKIKWTSACRQGATSLSTFGAAFIIHKGLK